MWNDFRRAFQGEDSTFIEESKRPRACVGTTVTVHNLFHNLPVRRRHLDESLEFEKVSVDNNRTIFMALLHCRTRIRTQTRIQRVFPLATIVMWLNVHIAQIQTRIPIQVAALGGIRVRQCKRAIRYSTIEM